MKALVTVSVLLGFALSGCSKSPESAAQDVCDCYKSLGDAKMAEVLDETKKCTQLAGQFRKEFKGEELKAFTLGIADCATGGLFK